MFVVPLLFRVHRRWVPFARRRIRPETNVLTSSRHAHSHQKTKNDAYMHTLLPNNQVSCSYANFSIFHFSLKNFAIHRWFSMVLHNLIF